ncbi:apbE family protein, partial [Neisseria meningitidis]
RVWKGNWGFDDTAGEGKSSKNGYSDPGLKTANYSGLTKTSTALPRLSSKRTIL